MLFENDNVNIILYKIVRIFRYWRGKAMKIRYILATLLTIALFSTIVYADPGDNPGQVIDNPWAHLYTTTPTTETPTTTEAPTETTTSDGFYDVSEYRSGETYTHPTQEGKLFAGWYTDSTCQTKFYENTGRAYAKFVDKNVMQLFFQEKTQDGLKYVRYVSSVDCLDYQTVGFVFNGTYGEAVIPVIDRSTTKAYTAITAAGYAVTPKVFSEESNYIFTYILRKIDPDKSLSLHVTPYWVTHDGTRVDGNTRDYPTN